MSNLTFKSSTIGLIATHDSLKRSMMIRVEFYLNEEGTKVTLKAVDGNTLNIIKSINHVVIDRDVYADRDFDCYNSTIEALWAFELLRIKV